MALKAVSEELRGLCGLVRPQILPPELGEDGAARAGVHANRLLVILDRLRVTVGSRRRAAPSHQRTRLLRLDEQCARKPGDEKC